MNRGRGFQHGWWLVLITIGVMYLASVPFFFLQEMYDSFLLTACGELVLIIPVVIGVFMLFGEQLPYSIAQGIGFSGFPVKLLPFVILLPFAAQPFAGILLVPVQAILNFLYGGEDYSDVVQSGSVQAFLQSFVLLCIAAPVLEEIICRGILMQLFRRYGTVVMLVYSSLGFAMMHLSLQSLVPLFYIGILLGIIRITSGSIFASMIAHSACNFYSLVLLTAGELPEAAESLIMIAGVTLFPILLWKYLKNCDRLVNWRATLINKYSPSGFSLGLVLVLVLFAIINAGLLISRLISGELFYNMMMQY